MLNKYDISARCARIKHETNILREEINLLIEANVILKNTLKSLAKGGNERAAKTLDRVAKIEGQK